jgi:hypothetical protein
VKLAEAPSFGRTIFEHAPDSNGARDYQLFAAEFLAMIGVAAGNSDGAPAATTNGDGIAGDGEAPPPLAAEAGNP